MRIQVNFKCPNLLARANRLSLTLLPVFENIDWHVAIMTAWQPEVDDF